MVELQDLVCVFLSVYILYMFMNHPLLSMDTVTVHVYIYDSSARMSCLFHPVKCMLRVDYMYLIPSIYMQVIFLNVHK